MPPLSASDCHAQIVNGPEILNKFVGQSEENIRNLFADAEKEQAERGDESDLHIIIFDEIDAICACPRSSLAGTHDELDRLPSHLMFAQAASAEQQAVERASTTPSSTSSSRRSTVWRP